jgi:hypothetical protein
VRVTGMSAGKCGNYTPRAGRLQWDRIRTFLQYGFRDGNWPITKVSDVNVDTLAIAPGGLINVKLAVVQTANGGGLTIYGKGYPGFAGSYYPGNTPTIRIDFTPAACMYSMWQNGAVIGREGGVVGLVLETQPGCGWQRTSLSLRPTIQPGIFRINSSPRDFGGAPWDRTGGPPRCRQHRQILALALAHDVPFGMNLDERKPVHHVKPR